MKVINILPPVVYNRLAAGEVVENPASIVKELVENSLDAQAQTITVQIRNGGLSEIVVIDDGEGVDETNLDKVFLPHATSKIKDLQDIDRISSLGFRGEALASIAAVAKVEFISKPAAQAYAAVVNEQGEIKRTSANQGTTVRVNDLFYNTPARRKFLRTATTEKNNVTAVIHELIFAHPSLKVRYYADGNLLLDYHGTGLQAAMTQIYDVPAAVLLPVDYRTADFVLQGFISNMRYSKPNRSRQVLVVNQRVVNGGLPVAVVNEVMANYLPVKEYAVFVLQLTAALDKVDVNVHPQKREVRFADKNVIAQFMRQAITQTLDNFFLSEINHLVPATNITTDEQIVPAKPVPSATQIVGKSFTPQQPVPETVLLNSLNLLKSNEAEIASAPNILNHVEINVPDQVHEQTQVLPSAQYKILGQVFETYLLVQTPDSLLIIDQHAMAERMNYDRFRHQIDAAKTQSQILLAPMILNLSPQELSKFEMMKDLLVKFGFECDLFGENTIRLTAVPAIMTGESARDFLRVLLNDKEIADASLSETLKHRIATNACKASIKAGDVLTSEQINIFLEQYFKTKNIPLCPHGRPIMLVYSRSRLESLFARK